MVNYSGILSDMSKYILYNNGSYLTVMDSFFMYV